MADPILVPFEGNGSGEADLTWGQQHIWDWMTTSGKTLNMTATRALDEGATIDEFVDELRFFMSRFEAMRTRYRFDEHGWPRQVVHRTGEATLRLVDAPTGTDPAEVAAAVSASDQEKHFDHANEWPVRMTLVRQDGRLTHLVTTLGHALFDSIAAMVMFTDLLDRDPATGAAKEPISDMTPLELAAWQASPAAQRQSAAALRYWEQHLRAIPARRSAGPVHAVPPDEERYWRYVYESPAIGLALRRLARRLGAETTSILLTAYAMALAEVAAHHPVVLQVLVNNRFRSRLARTVSPVNQAGLFVLDLAGATFDEAVARTRQRTISVYKHAYYNQVDRDRLVARVARERGSEIELASFVNDRRTQTSVDVDSPPPSAADVRAALPASRLRLEPFDSFNKSLMLTINDAPDGVMMTFETDVAFLPLTQLEAVVHRVEALVVGAALEEDGASTERGDGGVQVAGREQR
ncbi:hypothetical protein GCM10009681_34440 [Luedemannella helvata]|uniref:Condensation domain-containing protein n=2 Tax=Luedemannella helvata TaxID=349315 RepID=A0ABN2KMR0_9ACTN